MTRIEIDLGRFQKNLRSLRQISPRALYCLPVKADAYGHGLIPMAKAAAEEKVDYLAVACLQEGAALREAGINLPVLVLGSFFQEQIPSLIRYKLELSLHSFEQALSLAAYCRKSQQKVRVHLKIDTGMRRLGIRAEEAPALWRFLKQHRLIEVAGVFSHFVSSEKKNDLFSLRQIESFRRIYEMIKQERPKAIGHMANSGGLLNYPSSHFEMVRPGLLSYGYRPDGGSSQALGIAPCLSLKSRVSLEKKLKAGEGVSYRHTYLAKQNTRLATVPVGYGDGYKRQLSNRAEVLIKGRRYPIRGLICMDALLVEVGKIPVKVGDEVVLIGKQGKHQISLEELSRLCQSSVYEMACSFTQRVPKFYRNCRRVSCRSLEQAHLGGNF
jgi:alanine racemase